MLSRFQEKWWQEILLLGEEAQIGNFYIDKTLYGIQPQYIASEPKIWTNKIKIWNKYRGMLNARTTKHVPKS